jgi:hypothetical protein
MGVFLLILAVWILVLLLRYHVLTGNCYDHVEELLKGDQYAGRRRMRGFRIGPAPGGGLYQPTAITPANPYLHVRLVPGLLFAIWPTRHALRAVILHWTPLVAYPNSDWRGDLTDRVAHFLAVETGQVHQADMNLRRRRLTITRA